jgi:adapter protein MecA 1/2
MKIEKIGENIIKVTVSLNDLEERNIDLDALNYNSPAAQELFWDMMEQAEVEFGFNVSDSQLVIEPSTNNEEGFIITITRLDEDGDFQSIQKYIKSRYKKSDVRVKKKTRKIYSTLLIYSFNNFDDLCTLARNISSIYSGESALYEFKEAYYLILTRSSFTVSKPKILETNLDEYGRRVSNISYYEGLLNEYGTRIIENNAVEVLNSYF